MLTGYLKYTVALIWSRLVSELATVIFYSIKIFIAWTSSKSFCSKLWLTKHWSL